MYVFTLQTGTLFARHLSSSIGAEDLFIYSWMYIVVYVMQLVDHRWLPARDHLLGLILIVTQCYCWYYHTIRCINLWEVTYYVFLCRNNLYGSTVKPELTKESELNVSLFGILLEFCIKRWQISSSLYKMFLLILPMPDWQLVYFSQFYSRSSRTYQPIKESTIYFPKTNSSITIIYAKPRFILLNSRNRCSENVLQVTTISFWYNMLSILISTHR